MNSRIVLLKNLLKCCATGYINSVNWTSSSVELLANHYERYSVHKDHSLLLKICQAIGDNKRLDELTLSGNTIKKKTGQSLCESMEVNRALTNLALRDCSLTKVVSEYSPI